MADGDFKVKNGLQVGGKADIVYDTDLSLGASGVVYAGSATPTSPTIGDIWIDNSTNGNFSNYFRWRKTAVGGETSLSGLDDFGISLSYLAGNEQLYINGVLQYRGSDYTATNGTTITGIPALSPSDIIDIISVNATTLEQLTLYSSTAPTSPQTGTLWVDTSQVVNDTAQYLDYTSTTGFKNKIINGDFRIWQRGTSFPNNAGSAYGADRWATTYLTGPTTTSVTRQPFTPGIASTLGTEAEYYLRSTITTVGTATRFSQEQFIENVRTFAGETVTLSFWAKTDSARSTTVYILQNFGTGGSAQVSGSPEVISMTSSWTKYSITKTMPSISGKTIGDNNSISVRFDQALASGSILDIWGVQLEKGTIATSFENRPIGTELALCQRYYWRMNSDASMTFTTFGTGNATSATNAGAYVKNPVTMRTIPSSIDVTATASNYGFSSSNGNVIALSVLPILSTNSRSADITAITCTTAGSLTAGSGGIFCANANGTAYVGISAEL